MFVACVGNIDWRHSTGVCAHACHKNYDNKFTTFTKVMLKQNYEHCKNNINWLTVNKLGSFALMQNTDI